MTELENIKSEEDVKPKDLEKLVDVPVDQKSLVQTLKEKIDRFAVLSANYQGSKKQLQRVLVALAVHPFNERPFDFSYPEEKELFNLGVEITTEKLMFLHIGIEEQKMAKEIKERSNPNFILEETGLFRNSQLFDSSFNKNDSELKTENEELFLYKDGSKYKVTYSGISLINNEEVKNGS